MKYLLIFFSLFSINLFSKDLLQDISQVFYSQQSLNTQKPLTNELLLIQEMLAIKNQLSFSNLSEVDKLTIDAYTEDKFAELSKSEKLDKKTVQNLENIYEQMKKFQQNNLQNITAGFLTSKADLGTQIMSYKSLPTLISMAKQNKEDYLQALKIDETYFSTYIRLALWYYYAPKIGGGDLNISLRYLEESEKYAIYPFERFQTLVWKSQVYFRVGRKKESQQLLQEALTLFPEHLWIQKIQQKNKQNKFE